MPSESDDLTDLLMSFGHEPQRGDRHGFAKAPFGWVGGKTASLEHIMPEILSRLDGKFIDVFGGSGIVTWNVPTQRVTVYNDRYSGVVDFYRCLQNPNLKEKLLQRLEHLTPPLSREEWAHSRATWCTESDPVERAAKWFYMIKNSVISKGQCFARSTNSKSPICIQSGLKLFEPVHNKLQNIQLENLDWRVLIADYDSHDAVFYMDPPYVGTDSGIYEHKFHESDLRELLARIDMMKGTVILSHYENDLIDSQSYWTKRFSWSVTVTADANTNAGNLAEEYLWIKDV